MLERALEAIAFLGLAGGLDKVLVIKDDGKQATHQLALFHTARLAGNAECGAGASQGLQAAAADKATWLSRGIGPCPCESLSSTGKVVDLDPCQ